MQVQAILQNPYLALNPDQWTTEKYKGGIAYQKPLAAMVLRLAAFLPFTNELGNKFN